MTVIAHLTSGDLESRLATERDRKAKRRLQAIILALDGHSAAVIGVRLGVKRPTIARWVRQYNLRGLSSLQDASRPGRPLRLAAEQVPDFRRRLEAGPRPDDGICSLRGIDVQRILEQEFGVVYSLNGVYGLLHHLGYGSLMPRPQHCETNQETGEDFKKTAFGREST